VITARASILRSVAVGLPAAVAAACGDPGISPSQADAEIQRYCTECHNPIDLAGELSFASLNPAAVDAAPAVWEEVVRKLRTRQMPPSEAPRPDAGTYTALIATLEAALDDSAGLNPGRPVLRRLNRAEYANAIRDPLDL
jgi:hypothetical protein